MRTAEMNRCWKVVVTSPLMSLPLFDVGSPKNGEDPTGQFPTLGSGGNCEFTVPFYTQTYVFFFLSGATLVTIEIMIENCRF